MLHARPLQYVRPFSFTTCNAHCFIIQAAFAEGGMAAEFHVSRLVTVLTISLFVAGLGIGPLLVGPLSEVYGRNIIYQVSFTMLFLLSWPIVFAPNIGTYQVPYPSLLALTSVSQPSCLYSDFSLDFADLRSSVLLGEPSATSFPMKRWQSKSGRS